MLIILHYRNLLWNRKYRPVCLEHPVQAEVARL